MTTTYPDTTLNDDELDPLYGGRTGSEFGSLAWQWANNVLRFLSRAHLLHNRSPFKALTLRTIDALDVGDVVVHDLRGTGAPLESYAVRKAATGDAGLYASGELLFIGVCVEGASAGRRAVVARIGIVPYTLTGLTAQSAGTPISANLTTGKLKVASGGDVVLGVADRRGNLHLTF